MVHHATRFGDPDDRGYLPYSARLVESEWRRPDGKDMTREHLMMALEDLQQVLVRATYADGNRKLG